MSAATADEISAEALQACTALIDQMERGERPAIPNVGDYRIFGIVYGRCFVATVYGAADIPIVTIGIATHSRCGAETWRALHKSATATVVATSIDRCPPEPWCAARLEIGAAYHAAAMEWLGDFERCMAWAFVRRQNGRADGAD